MYFALFIVLNSNKSIRQRLSARLGRRLHQGLHHELKRPGALRRRVTASFVVAAFFSLAIIITATILFMAGVAIAIGSDMVWPVRILIAVSLLGLAWVGRPRFARTPEHSQPASTYPTLNRLVLRIATDLKVKPPARIHVIADFNAGVGTVGWRGTPVLNLGLPLVVALEPQELVALISHELAHLHGGDPTRHWLIGSTLNTLAGWYDALHPRTLWEARPNFFEQVWAMLANVLLLGMSSLILPAIWLMNLLLWREAQRAEYRADQIASTLAGRRALASLLRKFDRAGQLNEVVRARALASRQREGARDLMTRIQELDWHTSPALPTSAELGHLVEAELSADASHPPKAYRLDVLFSVGSENASLTLTQGEYQAILSEMWAELPRIEAELVDQYLARL